MLSRKRWLPALAVLATAGTLAAAPATAQAQPPGPAGKVVSAYFASWDVYGRGYHVKDIPADKLNVIQYAFGVPTFDKATGKVGCAVADPWADYQQVYWSGENSVDGAADNYPDQHLYGNFNQLRKLKAAHPNIKIEISLGGWTKSTWFSSVAATPERRQAFVSACVDTFIKGNLPAGGWPENSGGPGAAAGIFDGIDIDWEYPTQLAGGNVDYSPADRHNATLLFGEFRRQLDAVGRVDGKHYLLTAALPATKHSTDYFELRDVTRTLDWVNAMTYDFNVPGGAVAAPDTLFLPDRRDPQFRDPTWNTVGTVVHYLLNGVPADKLVVGVPFYANQYLRTGGLYQPHDSHGLDANSLAWDAKPQPSYHDLVDVAHVVTPAGAGANGFTRNWNRSAGEPWLYGPAQPHNLCAAFKPDGTCAEPYQETTTTLIAYTDPQSLAERTQLVQCAGLRGVMAWEISQDSDDHALISKLATILPH